MAFVCLKKCVFPLPSRQACSPGGEFWADGICSVGQGRPPLSQPRPVLVECLLASGTWLGWALRTLGGPSPLEGGVRSLLTPHGSQVKKPRVEAANSLAQCRSAGGGSPRVPEAGPVLSPLHADFRRCRAPGSAGARPGLVSAVATVGRAWALDSSRQA